MVENRAADLRVVGDDFAPNGCVQITRWVDDTHLLRKSCGNLCIYSLIEVHKNIADDLGSGGVFGVGWKVDDVKHPEYYKGEIIENRAASFVFAQHCEKKDVCGSIQIFKDIPDDVNLFPYDPYKPFMTIKTTKQMKEVDFENPENLASIGKQVKIQVANGYFIFDLQQGKVIYSTLTN